MAQQKQQGKDTTEKELQDKINQVKAQEGIDMDIPMEEAKFAPKFQTWIDSYERDVALFREVVASDESPAALRRLLAGGLMYLIKQLDLVPDYYQPVGTIDDTMVLRVVADLSSEHTGEIDPKFMKALFKLANDAETIRQYLGDTYRAFENYVKLLPDQPVRGITGEAVANDAAIRKDLFAQVEEEMRAFKPVAIEDAPRAERELKSYLLKKLAPK
jgi:uncharacterized membrane protein YkvA (DUF1232 family)